MWPVFEHSARWPRATRATLVARAPELLGYGLALVLLLASVVLDLQGPAPTLVALVGLLLTELIGQRRRTLRLATEAHAAPEAPAAESDTRD